jgi:hypothetical protein
MTKRIFSVPSFTPTATADGVLTGSTYMAIKGGSSTMQVTILEVYQAGQASASAYNATCLAYASTLETTPTTLALPATVGYVNPNAGALSTTEVVFTTASTQPTRSPVYTYPRMRLGFNAFGGIVRWVAAPSEEWVQYGNAANGGETLLSSENYGTAGAQAANIIYEVV